MDLAWIHLGYPNCAAYYRSTSEAPNLLLREASVDDQGTRQRLGVRRLEFEQCAWFYVVLSVPRPGTLVGTDKLTRY